MTETMRAAAVPTSAPAQHSFLRPGGRIVVGIDGSPASKQALRTAARLAELSGCSVEAVAVGEVSFTYGLGAAAVTAVGIGETPSPAAVTEAMANAAAREAFDYALPPGLRISACVGNPAKQILERAEGADLLVLGSRGHGAIAGLLLGSVSTKCAAAASCPVLIVHAPKQD